MALTLTSDAFTDGGEIPAALDTTLKGLSEPTKDEVVKAMKGHVIDQVELVGTYEKSK